MPKHDEKFPPPPAAAVDLMEALKASLERAKEAREGRPVIGVAYCTTCRRVAIHQKWCTTVDGRGDATEGNA